MYTTEELRVMANRLDDQSKLITAIKEQQDYLGRVSALTWAEDKVNFCCHAKGCYVRVKDEATFEAVKTLLIHSLTQHLEALEAQLRPVREGD